MKNFATGTIFHFHRPKSQVCLCSLKRRPLKLYNRKTSQHSNEISVWNTLRVNTKQPDQPTTLHLNPVRQKQTFGGTMRHLATPDPRSNLSYTGQQLYLPPCHRPPLPPNTRRLAALMGAFVSQMRSNWRRAQQRPVWLHCQACKQRNSSFLHSFCSRNQLHRCAPQQGG